MLSEEKEKLQDILRNILVALADINDMEVTVSRLKNEATELKEDMENKLNAQ